jgi:hypothetical protein
MLDDTQTMREKAHKIEFDRYWKAMNQRSTDINKLLNSHLLAEYYLEQIITIELPRGDRLLDEGNFQFWHKLLIVKSLDILEDEMVTSLKHLNSLRNSTSHEMNFSISEADIDKIGRPFGKEYQKIKIEEKSKDLLKYTLMYILSNLSWNSLQIAEVMDEEKEKKK